MIKHNHKYNQLISKQIIYCFSAEILCGLRESIT